jgi:hypothetical protein
MIMMVRETAPMRSSDVDAQGDQDRIEGALLLRGILGLGLGEGGPDGEGLHRKSPISISNIQCPISNFQVGNMARPSFFRQF